MDLSSSIINKVEQSGIITIDLELLSPPGERVIFDIKEFLIDELLLREKDFRESLKNINWINYRDKNVAVFCSVDALIPTWAFMLVASHLKPHAKLVVYGNLNHLEDVLFANVISTLDTGQYENKRVIIKGCSKVFVPVSAYMAITAKLQPLTKSIMFGEPCSTVPVFKKANKT